MVNAYGLAQPDDYGLDPTRDLSYRRSYVPLTVSFERQSRPVVVRSACIDDAVKSDVEELVTTQ